MTISIVMPVYEFNGHGIHFLEQHFEIFSMQTYKDFQLVISDNSKDNVIEDFCKTKNNEFDIKYLRHDGDKDNFTANTNNGIKNSEGDLIKILFQDDLLYGNDSLKKTNECFSENVDWLVSSCVHTSDGNTFTSSFTPRYNDQMHRGVNTISGPSVLTIRNGEDVLLFDERMIWFMDVDYYKRAFDKFGLPFVLQDVTVCIRDWDGQESKVMPGEIKNREVSILSEKYK